MAKSTVSSHSSPYRLNLPPADSLRRLLDDDVDVAVDDEDEDVVAVDVGVDGADAASSWLWAPGCRFCWEVVESEENHRFRYEEDDDEDMEDDTEETEDNRW